MEIEGTTTMRIILFAAILGLTAACGSSSEADTSSIPELPDSTDVQEAVHSSPQDAITGAYNLIDEAQSVTDQANARTEQLEQLIGDD
jgi:outer membrane murein-binding lipoprotein Lpp